MQARAAFLITSPKALIRAEIIGWQKKNQRLNPLTIISFRFMQTNFSYWTLQA